MYEIPYKLIKFVAAAILVNNEGHCSYDEFFLTQIEKLEFLRRPSSLSKHLMINIYDLWSIERAKIYWY